MGAETFTLEYPQKTITLAGFTRPRRTVFINSEVSGRCLAVSGEISDVVKTSEPLIRIDPTFILLDIQANRIAQKKLARKITLNKQQLERYQNLRSGQSVPQAQLDEISLQHDIAFIELEGLVNEGKRLEEIHRRHLIAAPPGYRIMDRLIEPGEQITQGARLAELGDFRELLVPLLLTRQELEILRAQSSIPVVLPDLNLSLEARFLRIVPGFDPQSRKTKADLIIPQQQIQSPDQFHGGERVLISINVPDQLGSYTVPASALKERHDRFWLTAVDGTRIEVVFLGSADKNDSIQISGKDLQPGETFQTHPDGTLGD